MKTDLITLHAKFANGEFLGFKLADDAAGPVADKTCDVKLGAAKLVLTKLGGVKVGLSKARSA